MSKELIKLSEKFSSLSREEKLIFIKENKEYLSYIGKNTVWLNKLAAAAEALMYTVQELI